MRAAVNASDWQGFAKENGRTPGESSSGAKFTAFDPHGTAHHMVRPASTVGSDDSSTDDSDNDTIPDPREQARIFKEEVCILALFLMTNTDCIYSAMHDLDSPKFQEVELLLSLYHHMLVGEQYQTPNPATMMMMRKMTIGEPFEHHCGGA